VVEKQNQLNLLEAIETRIKIGNMHLSGLSTKRSYITNNNVHCMANVVRPTNTLATYIHHYGVNNSY